MAFEIEDACASLPSPVPHKEDQLTCETARSIIDARDVLVHDQLFIELSS